MRNLLVDAGICDYDMAFDRLIPGECNWCSRELPADQYLCRMCHGYEKLAELRYWEGLYFAFEETYHRRSCSHHLVSAFEELRNLRWFKHLSDDEISENLLKIKGPGQPFFNMRDTIKELIKIAGQTCRLCDKVHYETTGYRSDHININSTTVCGTFCQDCEDLIYRELRKLLGKLTNKYIYEAGELAILKVQIKFLKQRRSIS